MQEFYIYFIILLLLRVEVLVFIEPRHAQQMREHVRRQMLNLIRDQNIVRVLDLDHVAEAQEFDGLDFVLIGVQLNHDVLGPEVAIHGTDAGDVLEQLGDGVDDELEALQAVLL